jgi:hypothetical protein
MAKACINITNTKKANTSQAQAKTMLISFYHKGIVPSEFLA